MTPEKAPVPDEAMTPDQALAKAIEVFGKLHVPGGRRSMKLFAEHLDVTKGAVGQWSLPSRRVPAEHCPAIERLVNRAVTCEQLRPDVDWAFLRNSEESDPNYGRRKEDLSPLKRRKTDQVQG